MKHILLALILLSTIGHAQNYQCLQSGVKRYFTNSNGYLRGMRIDSVKTMGDTTVYYPFHSRRGDNHDWSTPLDSNGASWLGKEVLQLADGTFLFDNMWHTNVKIKTRAHTGDSWLFFSDTSTRYYMAQVVSEGVESMPGGIDSVKKIMISAYDTAGPAHDDYVDSFTFTLSKNHAFASIFDLYTFPYPAIPSMYGTNYGYDYLLQNLTSQYPYYPQIPTKENSIFSVVSLINPTYEQLYDWHPGDVFENQIFDNISNGLYPYGYYFDSIIARTVLASSIRYSFSGWIATMHYPWEVLASGHINPDVGYPYDTFSTSGTFTISNDLLIDTMVVPEEKDQPWFMYYIAHDTNNCLVSNRYRFVQSGMPNDHYFEYFEASPVSREYKTGLGLIQYHWDILGGSPPLVQDTSLIYYVKGGETCGHYIPPQPIYDPTELHKLHMVGNITVYPNPASTQLTIQSQNPPIDNLTITNTLGQTIYSQSQESNYTIIQIDVSALPRGMYFIRINGTDIRKFLKE